MEGWAQVRVGAAVLLAVYVVVAVAFAPRELRFLAGVPPRRRLMFLAQDVLVQLAILAALLPCIIAPAPSRAAFVWVTGGFTALWIFVTWTLISRYMYTYRLMLERGGSGEQLREMLEGLDRERARSSAAEPVQGESRDA